MKKNKRCGNCGAQALKVLSVKGPFVWKDFPSIYLEDGIRTLTCENCGEIVMSREAGALLDEVISSNISKNVKSFIELIISRENITQTVLGERIGVTPEYLSEIKSGRKIPSVQVYNLLKILALNKAAYKLTDPKTSLKVS